MSKLHFAAAAIFCTSFFAACQKSAENAPEQNGKASGAARPKIGFILKTMQEERYKTDKAAFERYAKKLGAEVVFDSCNNDEPTQVAKVETMLTRGIDVLVLQPVNHATAATLVDKAHEKGVKVVSYDMNIAHSDVDWFVTQDSVEVGRLQAAALVQKLGTGKKVYLVKGQPGDANAEDFSKGVHEAAARGDLRLLEEKSHEGWAPERAQQTAEDAFTKYGKDGIDAFICNNSGLAWGVFQAVEARGLTQKIFIAGSDGDLRNIQAIAKDQIAMDVFKAIDPLASVAALVAVKLAKKEAIDEAALKSYSDPLMEKHDKQLKLIEHDNGKKKVPAVVTPIYSVTKETIDDTVVLAGYHSKEAVHGARAP